jgi:hypothetical protein
MARETLEQKAWRYLAEGRLRVDLVYEDMVGAVCRGADEAEYVLGFEADAWWCSCPARRGCAHLVALRQVVAEPGRGT